jgi:hypothetical protein
MFISKQQPTSRPGAILAWLCFVVIVISLSGCAGWQEKNITRHGIHFDKLRTEELQMQPGTTVITGRLAENSEIDGFPCARGFIVFHDNWTLKEFKLFRSHPFREFVMPTDSWVFPDRNGNIITCIFPRDVEIQGHLCRGGKGGTEGVQTTFHKNGSLSSYFSREDIVVNGIPCLGSVLHPVRLHANGQLQSCTLSRTVVIESMELLKKTRISFDDSGGFVGAK